MPIPELTITEIAAVVALGFIAVGFFGLVASVVMAIVDAWTGTQR